ncbi:hypothetical protein OC835_007544 [Tilletia horrida]|uniref:CCHC-type domain-containing protein n=1 Tax=Tilletia horrida TaxID=155126 RepID=A0AAN6JH21_9BASI|nr:hypothetical protein OC842_007506 [Tilletia horrida]KAK0519373.1 hypothetical protein OC835_007544 [Tilletia horrida]
MAPPPDTTTQPDQALPENARLVMEQLQRRVREGTPVDEALREVLAVTVRGEAEHSADLRSEPEKPAPPAKKESVVDTPVYNTAARTIHTVPKLDFGNYSTWLHQFKLLIQMIPHAIDHLEGREYPATHVMPSTHMPVGKASPGYDPELDLALGNLLQKTVGPKLTNFVMRETKKGGDQLTFIFPALKKHVAKADPATQITLLGTLSNVRQSSESIERLGDKLMGLFEQAANAGLDIDECQQVHYLCSAVLDRYHARRAMVLDSLGTREGVTFHEALEKFKQEEAMMSRTTASDISGAARATHRDSQQGGAGRRGGADGGPASGSSGGGGSGGRGRGPRGPICFKCKNPGHIKRNCPDNKHKTPGGDTHNSGHNNNDRDSFNRQ